MTVTITGTNVDGVDVSAHAIDLEAHTYEPYSVLRTGEYHSWHGMGATATIALTANQLYGVPFVVTRDMTVDRIACEVTAQAGQKIRMGIYSTGTNCYPGTLVVDGGELTLGATGVTASTISESLTKGLYFLAIISDATPTIRRWNYTYPYPTPLGIAATDFRYGQHCWFVAQAYGALPDPFTAAATLHADYPMIIMLRVASLD